MWFTIRTGTHTHHTQLTQYAVIVVFSALRENDVMANWSLATTNRLIFICIDRIDFDCCSIEIRVNSSLGRYLAWQAGTGGPNMRSVHAKEYKVYQEKELKYVSCVSVCMCLLSRGVRSICAKDKNIKYVHDACVACVKCVRRMFTENDHIFNIFETKLKIPFWSRA